MFDLLESPCLQRICRKVQERLAMPNSDDDFWNVDDVETVLLYSLRGLKPVGVNRYFKMVAIHQRFSSSINKEISSKVIWDHLDTFYDMATLHESEVIPFPNEEVDFELPEEFDDIFKEKYGMSLNKLGQGTETPKNDSSRTKKLSAAKLKQNSTPANSKNTFATPTSVRSTKSNADVKTPSNETAAKKSENSAPAKSGKVKRSSSPFATRNVKSETAAGKDDAIETPVSKKSVKVEATPASGKKVVKSEQNSSNSAKKPAKSDGNSGKNTKNDPDSKKGKEVVVPAKKGRPSAAESAAKKNLKMEAKKSEAENSRRLSDATSSKQKYEKHSVSSAKGGKSDDVESHSSSGSRKSSASRNDPIDKKRKRQKTDDSAKKALPAAKRRRT